MGTEPRATAKFVELMAIYLVRHAHAGSRESSNSHDRYRQLSDKGRKRAKAIAVLLENVNFEAILSSPATRCLQTVEPLAEGRDLDIIEHEDLWEDADTRDVMKVLDAHTKGNVVVSSHGNLIPVIVEQLGRNGATIRGRGCEKGSIWVLDHDGTRFSAATYISKTTELLLD